MGRRRRSRLGRRRVWAGIAIAVASIAVVGVFVNPFEGARAAVRYVTDIPRVEQHAHLLRRAAAESKVDPHLLAGIMLSESGGDVGAVSSADALGLMQLKLATAQDMARRMGLPEPSRRDLLTDAELNVRLGARYLRWLEGYLDGNVEAMLVGYLAGPGKMRAWIREAGSYPAWRAAREAQRSQLIAYVDKVLHYRKVFERRGRIVAQR